MPSPTEVDQAAFARFDRVLVTGADGFVGRHFTPALAARLKPGARLVLGSGMEVVEDTTGLRWPFDLMDPASVRATVEAVHPDLIVHLAGQAVTGLSAGAARGTWALNFGGTLALAQAIGDFAPSATLLHISSSEVYGLAFNRGPASEATPLEPSTTYARSKAATEAMLTDVLPKSSRLIVARPSNHIGVGQNVAFAIPAFAEQIAKIERTGGGGTVRVGNLDAERDFTNVRDVVAAYLALVGARDFPHRNVFNVASGRLVRVGAMLERLCALSAADISIEIDPDRWRPLDVPRAAIDASRLTETTGWWPVHTVDEAIAEVLKEHRAAQR